MTGLLKKIALFDTLQMDLPIERVDFVDTLNRNIGRPQPDIMDFFSRSKHTYKGVVTASRFELTRKRKLFDADTNYAKAKGQLTEVDHKLKIRIDVNGFHPVVIPFLIFAGVFYVFFITALLTGHIGSDVPNWIITVVLVHALLIFGLPYLIMRKSVSAMKGDIQRDLQFMMKDKLSVNH